eukprot:196628-Rhodomonas_salina.1
MTPNYHSNPSHQPITATSQQPITATNPSHTNTSQQHITATHHMLARIISRPGTRAGAGEDDRRRRQKRGRIRREDGTGAGVPTGVLSPSPRPPGAMKGSQDSV